MNVIGSEAYPKGKWTTRVIMQPILMDKETKLARCQNETESCKYLRALPLMPWKSYCVKYAQMLTNDTEVTDSCFPMRLDDCKCRKMKKNKLELQFF
jgi:hypothetical protein